MAGDVSSQLDARNLACRTTPCGGGITPMHPFPAIVADDGLKYRPLRIIQHHISCHQNPPVLGFKRRLKSCGHGVRLEFTLIIFHQLFLNFWDRLNSFHFMGPMACGETAPYNLESVSAAVR